MRHISVCFVLLLFVLAPCSNAANFAVVPDHASPGARVIVVGEGLASANVSVTTAADGLAPATVVSRSATVVEFVVPPNAITGPVHVASGGAAFDAATLTIVASPPLTKTTTLISGLGAPMSVAVSLPDGRLAVADAAKHQVRILQPSGATVHIFGSGKPGLRDGNDAAAQFKDPSGVAFDPETGDIYVADTGNHAIRRISGNTVATVAGSGRPGFRNGDRADAQFHRPMGIAVASDGEIVVADTGNHAIRRISTAGDVSTIAGTGAPGFRDGASATAQFHSPEALVAAGEAIYVTDTQNHVVRKVAGSIVTTIAGTTHPGLLDGAALMSEFHAPGGIAVSESGSVYIGDTRNHALRAVASDFVARLAGSQPGYVDGNLATTRFHEPRGIAWAGALFVADTKNGAVRAVYSGVAASAVYPAQGDPRGGEMIRVFGAGFVPGATGVTVGGLATAVQFVTSTELLVTTPPHMVGPVNIVVTTPGGSASLEGAFRYTPPFVAVELSPTGATLDEGQTIQFTATGIASDGTTSDLTAQAIWSSSVAGVASVDATGSARAVFPGLTRITATVDSLSASADVEVRNPEPLPPDPAAVAPPLSTTELTSFADGTSFLYSGPDPIQTGVTPGTIERLRAGVTRGIVRTREGQPLGGVTVRILDHPEFGSTLTRADGMFDIVVNAGTIYAVTFEKSGYIPAQRRIYTRWQDFAIVEDVVMIRYDVAAATFVAGASEIQVGRASAVTDEDGYRRATLFMPAGTTAAMALPDGTSRPLDRMTIRMTEYTVGASGARAMPADLPPTTGYTYCIELSVDEAVAAGATKVTFGGKLAFYVENFVGFPVGGVVPVGYYDRVRGAWIPSENGRVIGIVESSTDLADVDVTGDGLAESTSALAEIGITDAERRELKRLYANGASLWRIPIDHFTPVDCNWPLMPYAEPSDSLDPTAPQTPPELTELTSDDPMFCPGSIVRCDNQTLGEQIPITGTAFNLVYESGRVRGRTTNRRFRLRVGGPGTPISVRQISARVEIAGVVFESTFATGGTMEFFWDGRDAFGRPATGAIDAHVRVGYLYDTVYFVPRPDARSFLLASGIRFPTDVVARDPIQKTSEFSVPLGGVRAESVHLGGWMLSAHHVYDYSRRTLLLGNGDQRTADARDLQKFELRTAAGVRTSSMADQSGVATRTALDSPYQIAVGPDGSIYTNEWKVIRRIRPDGIVERIAGTGTRGFNGDGPALSAQINANSAISIGPDGSLYFPDRNNFRVRRIKDGQVTTVAGNGLYPDALYPLEESVAATSARVNPADVVVAPDGTLYIADRYRYIRRVTPDGIIQTVAGGGTLRTDGTPGHKFRFNNDLEGLALAPDGTLYFAEEGPYGAILRKIGPDGIVRTVISTGSHCTSRAVPHDGPAYNACLNKVWFLRAGPDGTLYIPDQIGSRLRALTPTGLVGTIGGNGLSVSKAQTVDSGIATGEAISAPGGADVGPDGSVYVTDIVGLVRRINLALPRYGIGETMIPASDGETIYVFSGSRHLRTVDALTGAVLLHFDYDMAGRLVSVTDVDGGVTTIERNGDAISAITAPGGQRTTFSLDANGYLSAVTNPAGQVYTLTYDAVGLLTELQTPRQLTHRFEYDEDGRLLKDVAPDGYSLTLSRSGGDDDWSVATTTALGRRTTVEHQRQADGSARTLSVFASGLNVDTTIAPSGAAAVLSPGGMVAASTPKADPRFGSMVPLNTTQLRFPSGRLLTMGVARTTALENPDDPLSLTTQTDRFTLNGRTTTTTYDRASRTLHATTPGGRAVHVQLDAPRRPLYVEVPNISPVTFTYANGLLKSMLHGDRLYSYTYDSHKRLASIVDPLQRETQFGYDAADRMTTQTLPNGRVLSFSYDGDGNVASVTPPSRPRHSFSFTDGGQLASYAAPIVAPTRFVYNDDRNLIRIDRPDGSHIEFSYDAAGLITAVSGPGTSIGISRDSSGRTSLVTNEFGTVAYAYDGALHTNVTSSGAVPSVVELSYDGSLRPLSETINGLGVALTWDDDDFLISAGSLNLTHHPGNGLLTGTTIGAVGDSYTYGPHGDVTGYTVSYSGSPIFSVGYGRDGLGRISSRTETLAGVTTAQGYVYDPMGRLAGVSSSGTVVADYDYDPNGNRTAHRSISATNSGSYDAADRLVSYGGATYTYTANGDLIEKSLQGSMTQYRYDSFGNLRTVALPGGTNIEYIIDAQNRRVGKRVNGALVAGWAYADQLRIVAELDGSAAVRSRFVYGVRSNVPDYMIHDGATYRIITDERGSPRVVVAIQTGAVAQRMDYDEFGNVLVDTNPGFQPFGFAGGLYDADTRLVRFGARDYDPHTGRWTDKDPLGFDAGDPNLYAYAFGDPINAFDPTGAAQIVGNPKNPYTQKLKTALEKLRKQLRDNPSPACDAYFRAQPNPAFQDWRQAILSDNGPPYIAARDRPRGVSSDTAAFSQKSGPFTNMWIFKDFIDKNLINFDVPSVIVHELGHLARQDTTDNEPQQFFTDCRCGALDPGSKR